MKTLRSLLVLSLAPALMAASAGTPQAKPAPTPQAEVKAETVDIKGLKSRLFILQHKDPAALREVLRRLLSGHDAAAMDANRLDGLKTLTVRDYPENLAMVEEAIKRLDVPTPAGVVAEDARIELTVHYLHASKDAGPDQVPEQLQEVVRALKGALAYKSYVLGTSQVQNLRAGSDVMSVNGSVESGQSSTKYSWYAKRARVRNAEGKVWIDLPGVLVQVNQGQWSASLQNDISLRDGETVVVGTSVLKDKGLVVVVTAKVLK